MGEDFEDSKRSPWIHLNPCIHEFMIFMIVKNKDTYKESQIRGWNNGVQPFIQELNWMILIYFEVVYLHTILIQKELKVGTNL